MVERQETTGTIDDHAESLIAPGERAVVRPRRRGQPPLVDPAAFAAESEVVVRVQLDAKARNAERTRHPGGGEVQHTPASLTAGSAIAAVGDERMVKTDLS